MPHLPADHPHYLMGVGTPDDLLEAVGRGIDMFDCVLPTRNGRHGMAFTRFGPINLRNARHADDPRPLDAESRCPAARDFARAYLHHLTRANEMLGAMLLSTSTSTTIRTSCGACAPRSHTADLRISALRSGKAGQQATCRHDELVRASSHLLRARQHGVLGRTG